MNDESADDAKVMTVGSYRPTSVSILQYNGLSTNLIKKYIFSYASDPICADSYCVHWFSAPDYALHYWWLQSIREEGLGSRALPVTTFGYGEDGVTCGPGKLGQYGGQHNCVHYLDVVDNGYGAVTKLIYDNWPQGARWHYISDVYSWDGVDNLYNSSNNGTATVHTAYDRTESTACFDNTSMNGLEECLSVGSNHTGSLVGFNKVTVRINEPNGPVLSEQRQEFLTGAGYVAQLQGKLRRSAAVEPSNGIVLTDHYENWSWDGLVTKQDSVTSCSYNSDGNNFLGVQNTNVYNVTDQGGEQWGRVTETKTYSFNQGTCVNPSGTTLENMTRTRYFIKNDTGVNSNRIIVPWVTKQYDQNSMMVGRKFYFYDGATDPENQNQTLSNGRLTLTKTQVNFTDIDPSNLVVYETIDTRYGYTSHGDIQTTTTYPAYGQIGYVYGSSNWTHNVTPNSNGRTTTISYDATNLYLTQVRNPLGHRVQTAYDDLFTWLPDSVTDVENSLTTAYQFDDFGRLHKVIQPGDSVNSPSVEYRYHDTDVYGSPQLQPLLIETLYKNNLVSGERTFIDGLGRVIQTRKLDVSIDGTTDTVIWQDTEYDPLGRVVCQTVPDSGTGTIYYTKDCSTLPRTTTNYDALGRVRFVTAPDGSYSQHTYPINTNNGPMLAHHNIVDANQHRIKQSSNALGQLVRVEELTGNCGTYWGYTCVTGQTPWDSGPVTTYGYNIQGNLTDVWDADNNNTHMEYDALGRKTSMDDPDMGHWTYEYDASSNLVRQKDANEDAICFDYDNLGRLVRKVVDDTPTNPCPTELPWTGSNHLASYTYDLASNGVGQLYQLKWGPDPFNNYDQFTYDTLGRMVKQERWLDGRPYTLETTSFDALHRPLSVKYPNDETVNMSYDREGGNGLTAGGDSLVTNITYNERGQMKQFLRGNNILSTYNYYGQTGNQGNSNYRLQTIQHGLSGLNDNLPDFTYEYDPVGNIEKITSLTQQYATDTQEFDYDHLNRLITASATGNAAYSHTYNYDELGNIDSRVEDGTTLTYGYGSQPHAVTSLSDGSSSYNFSYDANGNMLTRSDTTGTYTHQFDVENRLVSVVNHNGGGGTNFVYDAAGQRVKTIQPEAGLVTYFPFPQYEETVFADSYQWYFDGSGDDVEDTSPYRLHGSRYEAVRVTGISRTALDFDGSNDHVAFVGTIPIAGEMTVSAWVQPEQSPTGLGRVVVGTYKYAGGGANTRGWLLGDVYGADDSFQFRVYGEDGSGAAAEVAGFFDQYEGEWVHVAGVFRPGQAVELYINGMLAASDTTNIPNEIGQSDLFKIGAQADNTTQGHWDGLIDSLRISSTALTVTEIERLAHQYDLLLPSSTPTATSTPIQIPTNTPTPSQTPLSSTAISTEPSRLTHTPTNTSTPSPTATNTPPNTSTPNPTATNTPPAVPTNTPTVIPSPTNTPPPGIPSTVTPEADALVSLVVPNTNNGSQPLLRAVAPPNTENAYLRFNVPNVGATITRATLRLYMMDSNSLGYEVHEVGDNSWGEMSITYNNAPAIGALINSSGPTTANSWLEIDVTTYINSAGLYSLALTSDSTAQVRSRSREHSKKPELIIETGGSATAPVNFDHLAYHENPGNVANVLTQADNHRGLKRAATPREWLAGNESKARDMAAKQAHLPTLDPDSTLSGVIYQFLDDLTPTEGAILVLEDANGDTVATTISDRWGYYEFADVADGVYRLHACAWVEDEVWYGWRDNIQPPNAMAIVVMFEDPCPLELAPPPGSNSITIYAAGTAQGGVYPTMELEIAGVTEATFTNIQGDIGQREFEELTFTHHSPIDLSQVKVRYVNDAGNRNLYVDKIIHDGLIYEAEAATTYSIGSSANGCGPGYTQSETLYCNGYFQFVPTIQRSSYSLAGQTIALRLQGDMEAANNGLFYVYSDHLGSTSVMSDANGSLVPGSLTRYLPFGEYRGAAPTQTLTDRDFTGQKENRELGLLYYNARYYVPGIGRFASADSIVPDPTNPQSFNRYSYGFNNPIKYSDPTGHLSENEIEEYFGFNSFQETVDAFGDAVAALLWTPDFTWGDVMAYTCEACESGFGYAILLLFEVTTDSDSYRGAFWGLEATHYGLDYSGVEVTSAIHGKPEMAFSDEARALKYKDYSNIPINLERYGLEYGDMYAGSLTDVNGLMILAHGGTFLLGGFPIYNVLLEGYGYAEDFFIEPIFGVEPLGDLIQGYYPVIRLKSQWGWQYYSTVSLSPPGG